MKIDLSKCSKSPAGRHEWVRQSRIVGEPLAKKYGAVFWTECWWCKKPRSKAKQPPEKARRLDAGD